MRMNTAERVENILQKNQENKVSYGSSSLPNVCTVLRRIMLVLCQAPKPAEVARPVNKRLKRDPSKPIYKDEVAFELALDEEYTPAPRAGSVV